MSGTYDKEKEELLHQVFPNIASQLRGALGNIHSALGRIAPLEEREQDPQLDANAALLYQSYYRILRVVNNLTDAAGLLAAIHRLLREDDRQAYGRFLRRRSGEYTLERSVQAHLRLLERSPGPRWEENG